MATATQAPDRAVHTVLFSNDRLSRVCGNLRITGPVRFPAMLGTKTNPEIESVWLTPGGPNHNLSNKQLEIIKKSEKGKELLATGVLQIISPDDLEEASGTSTDYDDLTAISLIRDSEDREWLETSFAQEKRPAVREAIKKQAEAIDQRLTALSKRANQAD